MIIKNEPYYQVVDSEVAIFEAAFSQKLPLLLKGPTGTGKSRFVEYMAWKIGKQIYTVACHEETSSTDLLGRYLLKGDKAEWQDGPLTKAVREGAIIYLDEIAEARPDILVAIHSLTDYRRTLYLDKLGEELSAKEDFMLVASFNPGYQKGYKELKPSTRQRFVSIHFNHPEPKLEMEVIKNETAIDESTASSLVKIAGKIRNLNELGLAETVSTRLLVDAAFLINAGLNPRKAVETAVIQPLTDEEEIIDSLTTLSDLMI